MKRVIITLLAAIMVAGIGQIHAEKIEDRYVMRPIQGGLLYFILPYELPSLQKEKAVELDVTYITGFDSVRVNMSVYTDMPLATDSIVFRTTQSFRISDFETFFIDKENKKYVHRYSCRFPYRYWQEMYADSEPFCLEVYSSSGTLFYGFSSNKWKKEQQWMTQVMLLIERNNSK